MSHARIEEVSDSDPSEGDISDFDDDFDEREILKARPSQVPLKAANLPSAKSSATPPGIPAAAEGTHYVADADAQKYKSFQCIYPVYFDASRSRKEGRMVGKELAVQDPLAREIVSACAKLGLEVLFEPNKLHPKDWANPGRIKVGLKGGRNPTIKNSMSSSADVQTWGGN